MSVVLRVLVVALLAQAAPVASQGIPPIALPAASDVTLFRIFLLDGSDIVSYGEYARVGAGVVLSMPLGTSAAQPRLQLLTLPASSVDWPRTERYSASARYHRYLATRAEEDFAFMSAQVSTMLNQIALTMEPARALAIAEDARQLLVEWPAAHHGYREPDVREIVGIIDEAITSLTPAGTAGGGFQLSLVSTPRAVHVEPLLGMPSVREQVRTLLRLSDITPRAADRRNLLGAALDLVDDPESAIDLNEAASLRLVLDTRLSDERTADRHYAQLVQRVMAAATRAAEGARVSAVERLFDDVEREDSRLGGARPATVRALRAALDARLDDARQLRLRRTEWLQRRDAYREYVEEVSAQIVQLVKAHESLEAMRQMAGLSPRRVRLLQERLSGGVERLLAITAPSRLKETHELLVAAWRFAERATERRLQAVASGDVPLVREASSAAAGSLLLLTRAQEEMRSALELPQLR